MKIHIFCLLVVILFCLSFDSTSANQDRQNRTQENASQKNSSDTLSSIKHELDIITEALLKTTSNTNDKNGEAHQQENSVRNETDILKLFPNPSNRTFSKNAFSTYSANDPSITIIIGVKEYGPRHLPILFERMTQLSTLSIASHIKPLQIILTHIGPPTLIEYDILNNLIEKMSGSDIRYLPSENEKQPTRAGDAFNRAAKLATGDYLLFLSDTIDELSLTNMLSMASILNHPEVGIVGPALVDSSKGNTAIYSAGIEFILSKNPHKSTWSSWNADLNTAKDPISESTDVPVLVHRYQGHLVDDSRVSLPEEVLGISKACFMIKSSVFHALNGFDKAYELSYLDVDLSLRLKQQLNLKTLFVPQIRISVGPDTLSDDSSMHDSQSDSTHIQLLKQDHKHFLGKWLQPLQHYLKSSWRLQNLTLVWSMDCGTGAVLGFTTEAVNIIMELQKIVRVKVINEVVQCKAELKKAGFPEITQKTIEILAYREEKASTTDQVVVVMHKDPGRYDNSYSYNPPDLLIGRSMYETDSIPADWLDHLNVVDFIFVPSHFNKETFSKAGVNSTKLIVIPETIDLMHFDPKAVPVQNSKKWVVKPPELLVEPSEFNFISVFKWEKRKAWDKLLEAYFDEFSNPEDRGKVALYIRSNMAVENHLEYHNFVQRYASARNVPIMSLPRVVLMDRFTSYSKLPSMYKAANAFVSATHGEGWGLPLMEAMSMELPIISTNWSGSTEFTTPSTSFMVNVSHLTTANVQQQQQQSWNMNEPRPPTVEHKWAVIDSDDLRSKMRYVYTHRNESKQVGKAARSHLLEHFHSGVVSNKIIDKIEELRPSFATIKANRPPPTYSWSRRTSNNYGNQNQNSGSFNNWAPTTATIEKHGRTLVKSKVVN